MTDFEPEPVPPNAPDLAPVHPEDGPQDVPQEPGSVIDLARLLVAPLPSAVDSFLNKARSQLGYTETASGWTKYGQWYADTVAHDPAFADANWCDMFVSWCAAQCGLAAVVGQYAYTPWHAQWFADHGRWGRTPHVGDVVFYSWSGGRSISSIEHVGIVESVRSGAIVALEGNTSNSMMRRVRSMGFVVGCGTPAWPSNPTPAPAADEDCMVL